MPTGRRAVLAAGGIVWRTAATARSKCSSSTGRATTTGRCRKASCCPVSRNCCGGARGRRRDRRRGRCAATHRHGQVSRSATHASRSPTGRCATAAATSSSTTRSTRSPGCASRRRYRRLSYEVDRSVMRDFAARPCGDSVSSSSGTGRRASAASGAATTALRPLDPGGQRQAELLSSLFVVLRADAHLRGRPHPLHPDCRTACARVESQSARRAGVRRRGIRPGVDGTATRLMALAKPGKVSVVCSQGVTIPSLIDHVGPGLRSSDTRKGSWWVLTASTARSCRPTTTTRPEQHEAGRHVVPTPSWTSD